LSAEVQALANAEQELYYARLAWSEVGLGLLIDPLAPLKSVLQVPGIIAIDAKSIYDAMHGASGPLELNEKRSAIEMVGIQKNLKPEGVSLHWVHGEANLADALTKDGAEAVMQAFLARDQRWALVHDPAMRSAKRRKSEGVSRLGSAHFTTKPWLYDWLPVRHRTRTQEAGTDASDDAMPESRMLTTPSDSAWDLLCHQGPLRRRLDAHLLERSRSRASYVTTACPNGFLPRSM